FGTMFAMASETSATTATMAKPLSARRCTRMRRPRRHALFTSGGPAGNAAAPRRRSLISFDICHRLLFDAGVAHQSLVPQREDRLARQRLDRALGTAHRLRGLRDREVGEVAQ